MQANPDKSKWIVLNCLLLLVFYIIYSYTNVDMDGIRRLGILCMIQVCFTTFSWYKLEHSLLNAYMAFTVALFAFNVGQPILEVFSACAEERSILGRAGIDAYFHATFYSLAAINLFHFGALLTPVKTISSSKVTINSSSDAVAQIRAIKKVALSIAVITFPFYIYNIALRMILVSLMGYGALYDTTLNTGIYAFTVIGDFYTPALICLFFISEYTDWKKNMVRLVIFTSIFFPPLYMGGRSNAVIIAAIFLIIYSMCHRIKMRRIIGAALILYVFMWALSIIAVTREGTSRKVSDITQVIENTEGNPITDVLSEMGGSLYPLTRVMQIMPIQEPFRYGQSYLYSLLAPIPNLGFWDIHPAKRYGALDVWLTDRDNALWGLGFSIIAEAYYNFGYWGLLAFIFTGWLYNYFFKNVNRDNLNNMILMLIGIIFLWMVIKTVRSSFYVTIRAMVYQCLPFYLLMRYYYYKYRIGTKTN